MAYFSVTRMVAIVVPVSSSTKAISSPSLIASASSLVAETVTGIGQNVPSAIFMSVHTPFQSCDPMKPSSGVNPPIPIMMASPVSREVMEIFFSDSAFFCCWANS